MIRFHYKSSYLKAFDRLGTADQRIVQFADEEIRVYCKKGEASFGLRIKKLRDASLGEIYEARASQSLRIVWVRSGDVISFALLGNHEDVRNYLKNI